MTRENEKIDDNTFEKLLNLKIDFHNLNEEKIREGILKKKEYSFVVAYNLLLSEKKNEQFKKNEKDEDKLIFENALIALINTNKEEIDINNKNEEKQEDFLEENKEEEENIGDWQYGFVYFKNPKEIMTEISKILKDFGILAKLKSNFRFKCSSFESKNPNIINSLHFDENYISQEDKSLNFDLKNYSVEDNQKMAKFAENIFTFNIQLYSV